MEQVPDSQDVGSGAALEGESNLMHGTCGAGEQDEREQQEGLAEEQRGAGEDTCDCE